MTPLEMLRPSATGAARRCLRYPGPIAGALVAASALATGEASAQSTLRYQAALHGGVRVVGTTMGFDCGAGVPEPPGSSVVCVGNLNTSDSSPDIYFQDNAANALVLPDQARTAVTVDLPAGATVDHARLYWAGRSVDLLADGTVDLEDPAGIVASVSADAADVDVIDTGSGTSYYQSSADVTAIVSSGGAGTYRLTDLDAIPLANVAQDSTFAAWTLVIVYADAASAFAAVSLYDGFDQVSNGTVVTPLTLAVPASSVHPATLTVVAYEGDFVSAGDAVSWNGTPLSDAQNPADNFFNSSRSSLGVPVAGASDVPALSGEPNVMASYDLDTVDISTLLSPGSSAPSVEVTSTTDTLFVGALVVEVRGCSSSSDCDSVGAPACNADDGDCQVCVIGGDLGLCLALPDQPACIPDGQGGETCGCLDDADCGDATLSLCHPIEGLCVECIDDTQCPEPATCDESVGTCQGGGNGGGGAGGGGGSGGEAATGGAPGAGGAGGGATSTAAGLFPQLPPEPDFGGLAVEGGGCTCTVGGRSQHPIAIFGLLGALIALVARFVRRGARSRNSGRSRGLVES